MIFVVMSWPSPLRLFVECFALAAGVFLRSRSYLKIKMATGACHLPAGTIHGADWHRELEAERPFGRGERELSSAEGKILEERIAEAGGIHKVEDGYRLTDGVKVGATETHNHDIDAVAGKVVRVCCPAGDDQVGH